MQVLAKELIQAALVCGASDLTIFPAGEDYQVSLRTPLEKLPLRILEVSDARRLILFLKFKGGMDVAEKRRPQLGAADFILPSGSIRVRLSTVADFQQQESLVLRLMHGSDQEQHALFFEPTQWSQLVTATQRRGLYLFCGPVNSGKTSAMYSLAKHYSQKAQQVITVEDPVEMIEPSFLQIQTNPKISVTYDELVKLSLRHRPDILIVGEIRDEETAAAVIRGALTGHTIFSTLHVGSKTAVAARLLEFGVSEAEISQALAGIIFQRLLPCAHFATLYTRSGKAVQTGSCGVLFDAWFRQSGQAILDEWPDKLKEVCQRGQITQAVYEKES